MPLTEGPEAERRHTAVAALASLDGYDFSAMRVSVVGLGLVKTLLLPRHYRQTGDRYSDILRSLAGFEATW